MDVIKKAKSLLSIGSIALSVLALAGFFAVTASIDAMQRNYTLRREIAEETRIRHQLELEIAELEFQRIWRNSEEFQELALKRRFNMVADGETIIELPRPPIWAVERVEKYSIINIGESETLPNWRIWVRFLFGS